MKLFKNILCIILTFSILLSIPTNALTIPAGYEDAGITTYHVEDDSDTLSYNTFSKSRSTSSPAMQITANNYINLKFAQPSSQENNIPDKIIFLCVFKLLNTLGQTIPNGINIVVFPIIFIKISLISG